MIVTTTPKAGDFVATLIFRLRNTFPFGMFPRGFLALLHLPLLEEFSVCMFPLGPFFFAFACTSSSGAVPNGC
jgi:hypothetical protein